MLRFVTLIPVVLTVAAVLKLGATSIDLKLSTRPLAMELASIETKQLPIAVYGVQRELEYGLAFYRNQPVQHYESGNLLPGEHLLVAPTTWMQTLSKRPLGGALRCSGTTLRKTWTTTTSDRCRQAKP